MEQKSEFSGKAIFWFISPNSFIRNRQPILLAQDKQNRYKLIKSSYRGIVESLSVSRFQNFSINTSLIKLRAPTDVEMSSFLSYEDSNDKTPNKLFLVLDLDHTLLHTGRGKDAFSFLQTSPLLFLPYNATGEDSTHVIKFRPHIYSFLNSLENMFEYSVYTMGTRDYAQRISSILDSDKKLFKGRVVSRDDCRNEKVKKIENLLKMENTKLCIVDDSDKIWAEKECVLQIQKYLFWPGDHDADIGVVPPEDLLKAVKMNPDDLEWVEKDRDNVLISFKNVLKAIFIIFYLSNKNDNLNKITQVKSVVGTSEVMNKIRKSVLQGCVVHFIDCFASNLNPTSQHIWKTCENFGAVCVRAFSDKVTHIVVGNMNIIKNKKNILEFYKEKNILVIGVNWVYYAAVHFSKGNEEQFQVSDEAEKFECYTNKPTHYDDILKKYFNTYPIH